MSDDYEREQAIKRLEEKRDFVRHLVAYLSVNCFLVIVWAASGGGYFWPIWVIAGWGIGIIMHAWNAFASRPITEEEIRREMKQHGGGANR